MAVHEVGYFRLRDFEDLGDVALCEIHVFKNFKDVKTDLRADKKFAGRALKMRYLLAEL